MLLVLLQGDACLQAAPLMFLYMQHPHKPLPAAAHGLFCAVIQQTNQVSYHDLSCLVKQRTLIFGGALLAIDWHAPVFGDRYNSRPCVSNHHGSLSSSGVFDWTAWMKTTGSYTFICYICMYGKVVTVAEGTACAVLHGESPGGVPKLYSYHWPVCWG